MLRASLAGFFGNFRAVLSKPVRETFCVSFTDAQLYAGTAVGAITLCILVGAASRIAGPT